MYLKSIKLSGFKSFARPTTLSFTTPITAIVGPNGSGKSNIAEAIRFVLGEQSMKSLRGKRSEDLIFNGTKSLSRNNQASVSIFFDNSKNVFNIDYDEVELRRSVYRDGASEYSVNNSQARLKDIIELLASVHIGASGHHIISQGEADRILSASPKERRIMIEDALGLKIYQYKRVESERKLEKTRENLTQIEALRREIAPHLSFLKKQVEKIEAAEKYREELGELYGNYFSGEGNRIRNEEEKIKREKEPISIELKDIEKNVALSEVVLEETEKGLKKDSEIRELEEIIATLRTKKDALSRTVGRLEGMLEFYENESLPQEKKSEKADIMIPRQVFRESINRIEAYIYEIGGKENMTDVRTILQKIKEILYSLEESYVSDHTKESMDSLDTKKKYQELQNKKEGAVDELEKILYEEKKTYSQYQSRKESLDKDRDQERKVERALFSLRNRQTELRTKLELLGVKEERIDRDKKRIEEEESEAKVLLGEGVVTKEISEEAFDYTQGETLRRKIERLKIKIEEIGGGGEEIMKEYDMVLERDTFLKKETDDLLGSAETLTNLIGELKEKIDKEFKDGVKKINKKFQDLFSLMFGGGTALIKIISSEKKSVLKKESLEIEVLESDENTYTEEKEEGVEININLPQKRLRGLTMLSGGERALTSIALIFSITQVKPPPFLVLDETDAALDESNSRKYGDLLEKLAKDTQLIIITHNRETMSKAGALYGVTSSSDGVSRILSIKFDEAIELVE